MAYIGRSEEYANASSPGYSPYSSSPSTPSTSPTEATTVMSRTPSGNRSASMPVGSIKLPIAAAAAPVASPARKRDLWAVLTSVLGKAIQRLVSTGLLKPQVARQLLGKLSLCLALACGDPDHLSFPCSTPSSSAHASSDARVRASVVALVGALAFVAPDAVTPGMARRHARHRLARVVGRLHDPAAQDILGSRDSRDPQRRPRESRRVRVGPRLSLDCRQSESHRISQFPLHLRDRKT